MKTINIGIFAHIDAGKTTLTEQILHLSGLVSSPGTIEEGNTESDTLQVEIERGISVFSSLLQFETKTIGEPFRLNLLDTPGHLDFRGQVEAVLNCIDLAVVLIDGIRGVESQTAVLHEELKEKKIPEIFFINKLDRSEENLADSLVSLEELFGKTPPILFNESDYSYIWKDPEKFTERQHLELIEWNSELSDEYLKDPDNIYRLSEEGLFRGVQEAQLMPVLGGSAYFGQGVRELLEFIDSLDLSKPAPLPGEDILISKRIVSGEKERLTMARCLVPVELGKTYSAQGRDVSIHNVYRAFGENLVSVTRLDPGDMFLSPDLNDFRFSINHDEANFVMVLEPESSDDREELEEALELLSWEDPTYRIERNPEYGNYQIWGRGELHLEIFSGRLQETFKKKYAIGEFSVASNELLKNMVKKLALEHTAFDEKKSSGKLVANLRDTANFSKRIAFEVSLPEKIHNAIETGFHEALASGNFHLDVVGVEMVVESYEPPESPSPSVPTLLKVAVVGGLRNAILNHTVKIGPLSDLEITVLDGDVGNVLSLLQKIEAKILDVKKRFSGKSLILARASTKNLLGFSGALRNMTKGTGISYQRNSFNPENYTILK